MNHYSFISGIPSYGHPQSPRSLEKPQPLLPQPQNASQQPIGTQNEPQNLKIKQEIPENNVPSTSLPSNHLNLPAFSQNTTPHTQNLPSNVATQIPVSFSSSASQNSNYSVSATHLPSNDPLQSLKDVKVPGFSMPAAVAQSIGGNTSNERPSSGPAIENIKKEPEFMAATQSGRPTSSSPARPPVEKSPALKNAAGTPHSGNVSQTPPLRQSGM